MMEYINALVTLLNEMSPYLLLGFLVAGILHAFVPQRIFARHLAGRGWEGVVKASLLGVPLPLCSCGVIPTTVSLRKSGASKAASTSFLIATPQTGVDSIAATYSLLGLPFAILRPVAALITGVVGGKLVGGFTENVKEEERNTEESESCDLKKGFLNKAKEALRYGMIQMMQDVGKWLVIGLLVAAVITVAVPEGLFAQFADRPLLNMLVVMAIATPMYVCATGSIPIALSLMIKGMSPGAALVLLMAGPATNVASLAVIGKVLGRKSTIVYVLSIVGGAMAFGLMVDYVLPVEWFTGHLAAVAMSCHVEGSVLNTLCSIAFVALLATGFVLKRIKSKQLIKNSNMKKEYFIKGMMCNHCKSNVEKNLGKIDGVTDVTVDLERGVAVVGGDCDDAAVIGKIGELGYEFVKMGNTQNV